MRNKHAIGVTVLGHLPSGRELDQWMEMVYERQYEQAETPQEKIEIAAWIRASRMNGNNGRGRNG